MNDEFQMSDEKQPRNELAEVLREHQDFRDERIGILIVLRSVEKALKTGTP